jgi:hypothetical protein
LESDVAPWFPYNESLVGKPGRQFASLYFSRWPLDEFWVGGTMQDNERMKLIKRKGLIGYKVPWDARIDEAKIVSELGKMASGLTDLGFFKRSRKGDT